MVQGLEQEMMGKAWHREGGVGDGVRAVCGRVGGAVWIGTSKKQKVESGLAGES